MILLQCNCLFFMQKYVLFTKFIAEMKIPARIRSESSSMAKVRGEVATENRGRDQKSYYTK